MRKVFDPPVLDNLRVDFVMLDSHRRRRRDETVEFRRAGGVNYALQMTDRSFNAHNFIPPLMW